MTAQDLITSLRFRLNDTEQKQYSNYELLDALNGVLSLINIALCNISNDLITSVVTLDTSSGSASLPNDYQGVIKVVDPNNNELIPKTNEDSTANWVYDIIGGSIYANQPTIALYYKKSFVPVVLTDVLPVPDLFRELLKRYTVIYLSNQESNQDASLFEPMVKQVYLLVAGRDKSKLYRQLPFYV